MTSIRLHLNFGQSTKTLVGLARDSARVRSEWAAMPADLKVANREMLNLARTHVRVGHLRHRERQAFKDHQTYVHHARRSTLLAIGGHGDAAAYGAASAKDRGAAKFKDIHALYQQRAALDSQKAHLDKYGASGAGQFSLGRMASFHARGALFGQNAAGDPNTWGQWASGGAKRIVGGTKRRAGQLFGLMAAFSAVQAGRKSLSAYEDRVKAVHDLGVKMGTTVHATGDAFAYTGERIDRMRKSLAFTVGELRPGLGLIAKLGGTLEGAEAAAGFARYHGHDVGASMRSMARMRQFGPIAESPIGYFGKGMAAMGLPHAVEPAFVQTMNAAGYGNRGPMFMETLESTQRLLGRGQLSVSDGQSEQWLAFVSRAMGESYRNERGKQFIHRVVGAASAPGQGVLRHAKMRAIRDIGVINLGTEDNPIYADPKTYRGAQMLIESGHPKVTEAFFSEAMRTHGAGEFGAEAFQSFVLGRGRGATLQGTALWQDLKKHGGRMPDIREGEGTTDAEAWRVRDTKGFEFFKLAAEAEEKVFEAIGKHLVPVAHDFKDAAIRLTNGLLVASETFARTGEITEAMSALAAGGLKGAYDILTGEDSRSNWTKPLAAGGFLSQMQTWLGAIGAAWGLHELANINDPNKGAKGVLKQAGEAHTGSLGFR